MDSKDIMALVHRAIHRGYPLNTNLFLPELKAAIEALQADAARYRWLRGFRRSLFVVEPNQMDGDLILCDSYLDAAIDAAMALDKPKSGT